MRLFIAPGFQFERQDEESDAEHQRICTDPPREHQRSDQRRDDQQYAVGKRGGAAENEPPAAVVDVEAECGAYA
jgi:hypothetical protein